MSFTTEDVFVLLPGIMGSVLAKNGKEVWGPSAGSIFRALKSRGQSAKFALFPKESPVKTRASSVMSLLL